MSVWGVCAVLALAVGRAGAEKITEGEVIAVAQGSDAFACDLYGQVKGHAGGVGNVVFSPLSLSTALNMTALGARGATAAEMAGVLHHPATEHVHVIAGGLAAGFQRSKDYTLMLDNNLWLQQGFTVRPEYAEGVRKLYRSEVGTVDFGDEAKARAVINASAAKSTEGRIKELIGSEVITKDTRLVLTNTVYFRGAWETAFAKKATYDDGFYLTPARRVNVPMMHETAELGLAQTADYTAVEIPYRGKRLAMLVLVPREGKGLGDVEKRLTAEHLRDLGAHMGFERVALSLPRFRVSSGLELKEDLGRLGMKTAFGGNADFSGVEEGKQLELGAVVHKATIEVNEEGTEAVAASAVSEVEKGVEDRPEVTVDRPFVWMIVERNSRMIFFMGRVGDPRGS